MIQRFFFGILLALWSGTLVLPVSGADVAANPAGEKAAGSESQDKIFRPFHVSPGPIDGQIAFYTAALLEKLHYSQKHFDESVSIKFLDRYLESLDPQHLHFIQADLDEFEHYRRNLHRLTKNSAGADTHPSCEIFERFVQRLQQR